MASVGEKYKKRRLRSAYLSVVISIALVLYLLGIFGILVYKAQIIAREVKENFALTLLISNDASALEVKQFQKKLSLASYVKSTEYVSKEEAAQELQGTLEEDFVDFLGYNPLMNAIDIHLQAEYVDEAKIKELEQSVFNRPFVHEIVYDRDLVTQMNANIKRIGLILVGGSLLLALVSITLINNSIRLSIYSSRFIIKTMQLVGATKSFVRRPFITKSMLQGFWGSVLAFGLLLLTVYYANKYVEELAAWQDYILWAILFGALLLIGLLISTSCTFFALRKYLKIKPDQLYF